jgi:hypothetical protein
MDNIGIIVAALIAITVGYWLFLKLLLDRQVLALRARTTYAIVGLAFLLELVFLASRYIDSQVFRWLFHLNKEKNIPTTYISLLLLSVGITGLLIAVRLMTHGRRWQTALYWGIFGAFFTFLAFDEYFVLHERVAGWHVIYAMIGAALVAGTALNVWAFDRSNLTLYAVVVLGLACIGAGGIGFDWTPTPVPFGFEFRYVIEEYLECIGASLILFAGLSYVIQGFDTWTRRLNLRLLFLANAVWIVGTIFVTFWPLSWLEIQQSDTVEISLLDGDLSLAAYRIESGEWASGQVIRLSEYWRAHAPSMGPMPTRSNCWMPHRVKSCGSTISPCIPNCRRPKAGYRV